MLVPKLFTALRGYTQESFFADLIAGVIVGIVSIPLAIAFGIASGVSPQQGLFTAIIAGFIISALGGSRVQIGGPTGAFVVIVYGIVTRYGVEGLTIATILAGLLLVAIGVLRLGNAIKFIPHSVTVGFTSGIAVIIFSSQIKDFFGLSIPKVPAEFIQKVQAFTAHWRSLNLYAVLTALGTVLLIALWPKVSRKVPGSLIAILIFSAVAQVWHWPVETIGTRFGNLPKTLPLPHFPTINLEIIRHLFKPAIAIALLGGIESLLSAVVADGMIGGKHRSNMELVAQGIANISSAIFGGMPASGAIARTATNIKNGGRTPVAGIVHAGTILAALLFFGQWIKLIPLACLAGVLTIVSYHMSEWRSFREIVTSSRGAAAVLLTTFFLTVFIDLIVAIEAGMVLSVFLFMKRMADTTKVRLLSHELREEDDLHEEPLRKNLPEDVEVYEVDGPLFFGAADKFNEAMRVVAKKPKIRILRLKNIPLIDSSGLHALKSFYHYCRKEQIRLLIAGLHGQPLNEMMKSDLYDLVGEENVFGSLKEALAHAERLISNPVPE